MDQNWETNIVHYGSVRRKYDTISVMEAEMQPLILGFDQSLVVKKLLKILQE